MSISREGDSGGMEEIYAESSQSVTQGICRMDVKSTSMHHRGGSNSADIHKGTRRIVQTKTQSQLKVGTVFFVR